MNVPPARVTRRQLIRSGAWIAGGASVAAAAGAVGYEWQRPQTLPEASPRPAAATPPSDSDDFVKLRSLPDLRPPKLTVVHTRGHTPPSPNRLLFFSPGAYHTTRPSQDGLMAADRDGRIVWFSPKPQADHVPFDLQVQSYQGSPVLTWWEGQVTDGTGSGMGYIADATYQVIKTIQAGNGLTVDLHELNLTPSGSALITAYRTAEADLSALGGPRRGQVYACQAQEVDIASGKLLFSWDSLAHVPIAETYNTLPTGPQTAPFDYFHMNSVALAADGNLLISSRNTWTVYKVSRTTGDIMWRLGGKQSDFEIGPGARFYWQHDVRAISEDKMTIFDDGASPAEELQSRGLLLELDVSRRIARLVRAYENPAQLLADNQGSVQVLPDGQVFVGWGNQPYFSQFTPDGELVFDGRFPRDIFSYRAFSFPWTGRPGGAPEAAVEANSTGGATVYVSWNGATEVHHWVVLAGDDPASLEQVAEAHWAGLETVITVCRPGKYLAVVALDAARQALGRSAVLEVPA